MPIPSKRERSTICLPMPSAVPAFSASEGLPAGCCSWLPCPVGLPGLQLLEDAAAPLPARELDEGGSPPLGCPPAAVV
eukprot:14334844-Heterocapsa_arctica.AAC.1